METSEFIQWIIITAIGAGIASVGGYLLTRPRLINPKHNQKTINVEILEKEDMTINSTSGLPGVHYQSAGRLPIPYKFFYITIENRPFISLNSTAKGVSAEVVCIGRKSKRKIGPYYGRPMDTPAPGSSHGYGDYEASKVDIPPGKPLRGFYIAFIAPGEDKFYGFSQNSYKNFRTLRGTSKRYYDWKNPDLEMGGEVYDATVVLDGENVKPFEYKFTISKKGKIKTKDPLPPNPNCT